ncbi:MAG: cell wall hydrolase, partial [Peptococcaceae bacterium]|nr:cell wall hydrolase [Peptococcaceae bacterium]
MQIKSWNRIKILCCACLLFSVLFWCMLSYTPLAQAKSGTYSSNDITVLAKMIHGEARGESYIGKVAVAAVILNRVEDKKFPDSVHSVCFQPGAFDAVRDGQYYMEPDQESINAAKAALNG